MPREATGQDDILVGRIRRDLSDPTGHSLCLFVAGDQLRNCSAKRGASPRMRSRSDAT